MNYKIIIVKQTKKFKRPNLTSYEIDYLNQKHKRLLNANGFKDIVDMLDKWYIMYLQKFL